VWGKSWRGRRLLVLSSVPLLGSFLFLTTNLKRVTAGGLAVGSFYFFTFVSWFRWFYCERGATWARMDIPSP